MAIEARRTRQWDLRKFAAAAAASVALLASLGTSGASASTADAPLPNENSGTEVVVVEQHPDGSLTVRTVLSPSGDQLDILSAATPDAVIVSVEPQIEVSAFEDSAFEDSISISSSNDARRNNQWALDRVAFETTWPTTNGSGVVVAILDTGVLATHEDLVGRIVPGADFVAGVGDGTLADHPHGSHVAGIVGASANNSLGIAGGAPGVQIMPVRVLNSNGSGSVSGVSNGIIWAVDHGADVINLSLGTSTDSSTLRAAVAYAESRGVVIVAAAGNAALTGNPVTYPAAIAEVVAVGATTAGDARASYSNHGTWIDIVAPGSGIWSLANHNDSAYASMSGTSMASPYVAAATALVVGAAPGLTPAQTRAALFATAEDLGPVGKDNDFGVGLINPLAAVQSVHTPDTTADADPPQENPPAEDPPAAEPPVADQTTYSILTSTGRIIAPGSAAAARVTSSLNAEIVGGATTPSGAGAWLVGADGGVFAYGDAGFFGSAGHLQLNLPIVGMAATPSGNGYWLVASDGGIFTYGDAVYYGSTGAIRLNQPITGMAATPTGNGYWLVASDGGIFTFGDAGYHGSTGNIRLNQPITGMAATPTGNGYWLVASDGGIFTFGDAPFMGSAAGQMQPGEIVVGVITEEA
ncbi:MAG: serine protease [Candidatus Poriferisodalaceae bacterium]